VTTAGFAETDVFDVAIIGGGIGGAAAAVALRQAGFDAVVFERAEELREVGGGVVLREPSRALLEEWGVLNALKPKMVAVAELEVLSRDGSIIAAAPAAIEPGATHTVHRADLHGALISHVPAESIQLGHRLRSVANGESHAEAEFENGRRIRARLIVGADGLRSRVRSLFDSTPMTFHKSLTNRTIAPADVLPAHMANDRIRVWQDGEKRLIMLPIRGGTQVSLNAAIPIDTPPDDLWGSMPADELLAHYDEFDPVVRRLIEARLAPITTHPVYDKDPIEKWSEGRVVLLGDAAHPMSPMNGQGANQAIQDAGALAEALKSTKELGAALLAYQTVRAPATTRIQTLSRKPPPSLSRPAAT
jgi:salicylate hydroxylase